eukprot:886889-Rhodomonas_salina.1
MKNTVRETWPMRMTSSPGAYLRSVSCPSSFSTALLSACSPPALLSLSLRHPHVGLIVQDLASRVSVSLGLGSTA